MASIQLATGQTALVDDADLPLVEGLRWTLSNGYVRHMRWERGKLAAYCLLHRLILDAPKGTIVDHANGDPLDNRRANLRFATNQQNAWNRGPQRGKQYRGVASRDGAYTATIHLNGRGVYLGTYSTAKAAARRWDEAALKHHGEFARLNFPQAA